MNNNQKRLIALATSVVALIALTGIAQPASASSGLCGRYTGNAPQCQKVKGGGNGFVNPKMDPRFNPKADPRFNPRADPRFNSNADPRFNSNADPRFNPQGDPCGIFGDCR